MSYSLEYTGKYRKSLKICLKRGLDIKELYKVLSILVNDGKLPSQYRPHILHGKYDGIWECHIKGDWLLLWTQNDSKLKLLLVDTGSHADLFDHS